MKTIKLAEPWTYRTAEVTIDYPAGEHEVTDRIAAAAPKEKANGSRTKASSQGAAPTA